MVNIANSTDRLLADNKTMRAELGIVIAKAPTAKTARKPKTRTKIASCEGTQSS